MSEKERGRNVAKMIVERSKRTRGGEITRKERRNKK